MKKIEILILVFSCCLCEAQVNESNDKVRQCSGSTSCCDSLTSLAQNLGALGEKVANMVEKITLLETKLQNTENDVLELRSLIEGKRANVFMGYDNGISFLSLVILTSDVVILVALRDTSGGLFCNSQGIWLWKHWTFHNLYPTAV